MTRKKGRDIYDLWFLLNKGVDLDAKLIKKKLKCYGLEKIKKEFILKRIESFPKNNFVLDLRPFVPLKERKELGSFFDFVRDFLRKNL